MNEQKNAIQPATTDITIAPDGRVFIFGLSEPVLQVASALDPYDVQIQRRLERLRRLNRDSGAAPTEQGA